MGSIVSLHTNIDIGIYYITYNIIPICIPNKQYINIYIKHLYADSMRTQTHPASPLYFNLLCTVSNTIFNTVCGVSVFKIL